MDQKFWWTYGILTEFFICRSLIGSIFKTNHIFTALLLSEPTPEGKVGSVEWNSEQSKNRHKIKQMKLSS